MKNILLAGLAAALLCVSPVWADDVSNGSWSTTDGSNTAAPPNGWPAGMAPNQVEPTARSNMGGVKRWWERANPSLSTTGSAGAYVLTPSNTSYPTAYTQGEVICAKASFASVGGDTLNVNSLGAKKLYSGLVQIGAGAIQIGQQFCASYDGALNSAAGGFQILGGANSPGAIWKYTSGSQSLSTSNAALIDLSASVYDTASICSLSTNVCTPTVGGYYLVGCTVRITGTNGPGAQADIARVEIVKNTTTVIDANEYTAQASLATVSVNGWSTISTFVQVNGSSDTVGCRAYTDDATAPAVVNGSFWGSYQHS